MELELRDYLAVLYKRRWIAAAVVTACLVAAAAATAMTTPMYQASSKLFVGQRQIATSDVSRGVAVSQLSLQLLKSYAAIIRTRPIAERAVETNGLPLNPSAVARAIRADPILDTQIIQLSFQSADPALAQRVVNAVADAFVKEAERIETRGTSVEEPAVKVSVVEPALRPDAPVRPQPVRNLALAFVLGAMLGVGLAFAAEYLDTTVKDGPSAEALTGAPVLASIPKVDVKDRTVFLEQDTQSPAAEAFRKLRTAVQFLSVDHPVQLLLVTSPEAAEGKTTTAVNLSAALARAGVRTIMVEADLRRPVLHTLFATDQRGLTNALIGRMSLADVVRPTAVRNLSFVSAGAIPPNPAELLASDQMADILKRLRDMAEVIVVDTPPILPVADASALAARTDGVILVARAGKTHRDRLAEASQLVGKLGGRLLGTVLNFQTGGEGRYGSYYGYRPRFEASGLAEDRASRVAVPRPAPVDQTGS